MKRLPKGQLLNFNTRPYLVAIYEDLYPQIVVQKSAQTGATVFGIARALWFADTHSVSIIYTFPTKGDVTKFTATRINPVLQANPELLKKLTLDNVEIKQFGTSFIYFRGTKSELEALSVDADLLVHDERDKGAPDIYDQYRARLYASQYKFEVDFSTPTYPSYGINTLYEESDQHEWFVRCSHCNKMQTLGLENLQPEKFICSYCGEEIYDEDRLNGVWAPKYSNRNRRGYHISQFCSVNFSAKDITYEKEHRKPKNFHNLVLGIPFEGQSSGLTRSVMLEKCFVDGFEHQEMGRMCGMGIDQGDILHIAVGKISPFGALHVIHLEKARTFERVKELMNQYGVDRCVMDALPNTHDARKIANDFPGRVKLAFYKHLETDVKEDRARVLIDRTENLDAVVDAIYGGNIQLYRRDQDVDEFISHCCNERREVEEDEDTGLQRHIWINRGADHYLHALNYLSVALSGYGAPKFLPNSNSVVAGERDFKQDFGGRGDVSPLGGRLPKIPREMEQRKPLPRPGLF